MPNSGGGNEDNGDLLPKVPWVHNCTQSPGPCSRPPLTHASARDSWTLTGKSGSVSCGVTAPFSWVLVCTCFVCALQASVCPVLCKFWQLYDGVIGDLLQEALCHTQVCCSPSACPCGRPLLTRTSTGDTQTLKGRSGSVSVGSLGGHQVLFEPCVHLWWVWGLILNAIFAPPIVLLGLLLCPWTCGFFFWWDPTFSPVNDCSTVRCNFGVLTGIDERTSFCSIVLDNKESLFRELNLTSCD